MKTVIYEIGTKLDAMKNKLEEGEKQISDIKEKIM